MLCSMRCAQDDSYDTFHFNENDTMCELGLYSNMSSSYDDNGVKVNVKWEVWLAASEGKTGEHCKNESCPS